MALLPDRALVRVEGSDWRPFLHNLLTNDIEGLEPGRLRFTALLTPQGRLLHDLFVLAGEAGALLDVAAPGREALIKRLTLYRLRAKVLIEAVEGSVAVAWGAAPPGPAWAADPRLSEMGWRALGYDGPLEATPDDYDLHRLTLGVPDSARDASESTYPIEANFDLLNGIDFKKGCFIGQETTSRMKRRGAVKTRMAPIAYAKPPAQGAEILNGDLRAGVVLSTRADRGMALLRLDRIGENLTADGEPVSPVFPAWLAAA
jgi:hypothetical protein